MAVLIRLRQSFPTGMFHRAEVIVREELIDKPLLDVLCDEFDGYGWEIDELKEDTAYVHYTGDDIYGRLWECPPHTPNFEGEVVNQRVAEEVREGMHDGYYLNKWLIQNGYLW